MAALSAKVAFSRKFWFSNDEWALGLRMVEHAAETAKDSPKGYRGTIHRKMIGRVTIAATRGGAATWPTRTIDLDVPDVFTKIAKLVFGGFRKAVGKLMSCLFAIDAFLPMSE